MDTMNTETQKIAYWSNGLWCDQETAEHAVNIGGFPADYEVVEFPADADPALIDTEIKALLVQQGA